MKNRLSVINAMIRSTGARPLTAEQNRHPSYQKADSILEGVRIEAMAFGWWFNTEIRIVKPQSNGELIVPFNCIKADAADRHQNVTLRNRRLYDLDKGTYEINKELCLVMYFDLGFDEIPLEAQNYLENVAVFEYYLDEDGADPKLTKYEQAAGRSYSILRREHLRNSQTNIFDNPGNMVNRLRRGTNYNNTRSASLRIR